MKTIEIQDKFNQSKVWVIKVSNCNHYYINQKINGQMFYPAFQKTRLKTLRNIGLEI